MFHYTQNPLLSFSLAVFAFKFGAHDDTMSCLRKDRMYVIVMRLFTAQEQIGVQTITNCDHGAHRYAAIWYAHAGSICLVAYPVMDYSLSTVLCILPTLLVVNSFLYLSFSGVTKGGGLGCSNPPPGRNSEGPPKLCQTQPDCENC